MEKFRYNCSECNSIFTIKYDDKKCEFDPQFCPFCAEYILREDDDILSRNYYGIDKEEE